MRESFYLEYDRRLNRSYPYFTFDLLKGLIVLETEWKAFKSWRFLGNWDVSIVGFNLLSVTHTYILA